MECSTIEMTLKEGTDNTAYGKYSTPAINSKNKVNDEMKLLELLMWLNVICIPHIKVR